MILRGRPAILSKNVWIPESSLNAHSKTKIIIINDKINI